MTSAAGGARNLADLVRRAAAEVPDRPALVEPGSTLTWSQVDVLVDRTAAGLAALGLLPGDRVAIQLGNIAAFPVAYFGVLRAGLVAVPVHPGYTTPETVRVLSSSGARVLVTQAGASDLHASVATLEHVLRPSADRTGRVDGLPAGAADPVEPTRGGEDLAALLFTSGTSGRPRGAMLTHRALLANLEQLASLEWAAGTLPPFVTPDDVVLLVLPLCHVYGLNTALGMVARQGATGVLVERFEASATLAQLPAWGVTCVMGVPAMYVDWSTLPGLADAFAAVRVALSGAAPLPRQVLQRYVEVTGSPLFEGYGLTETAPVLTSTLLSAAVKPGSVGRPLPGVELRLLDGAGRETAEGDPGEIVVRGANLFSGYWPGGEDGPDADGWWATGDIAYADADGDLHLVDRRREVILVSGFNVYPREVEDVLLAHPDIVEAAVLGLAHPRTGETVQAFVVVRDGAQPAPAELIAHCARSLAAFKCPTSVRVVAQLPHSATGKVSKGRLRELSGQAAR